MATQEIGQETELARAWAFLAEHGIAPDATGAYPEEEILAAIRGRGWAVTIGERPGESYVNIGDERAGDDGVFLTGSDPDREVALLRVLDSALLWLDRDAAREAFERETRETLGITGQEFLLRWDAGEYDEAQWDPAQPAVERLASLVGLVR